MAQEMGQGITVPATSRAPLFSRASFPSGRVSGVDSSVSEDPSKSSVCFL